MFEVSAKKCEVQKSSQTVQQVSADVTGVERLWLTLYSISPLPYQSFPHL